MAMASPPPMHSVARPRCTSFSFMECSNVTTMRFPEQPIGWPRATAPPQTLKTSQGMPSSFLTPMLAEENASLCSTKSNSSSPSPVRFISFCTHGIGANITSSGLTAWEQKSRIVPSGSTPISRAVRSLISTVALAPSEIWDELPAVSTPSFLNTGGGLAKGPPGVAEVEALAGPRHQIRRPRHVLRASRDDDRIGVVLDRAHALDHRLHPAAANHVHGGSAHALRNPREDDDLAGTVLVEPRLDHGAEEQLADVFRLDVRPADRLPHREGAQPGRRHVRERALEPADRGPRRARDDDLGPRRHIPATSERLISNCWRGATDPWRNRSRSMITMLRPVRGISLSL